MITQTGWSQSEGRLTRHSQR